MTSHLRFSAIVERCDWLLRTVILIAKIIDPYDKIGQPADFAYHPSSSAPHWHANTMAKRCCVNMATIGKSRVLGVGVRAGRGRGLFRGQHSRQRFFFFYKVEEKTVQSYPATTSKRNSAEGQQSEASTSHDGATDANVEMTNGSPVADSPKGQETFHYQLTTTLFSLDRSCWSDIESVMEQLIKYDNAEHRISPEEKQRTLEAVQQYMESAIFYERQIAQRTQEPLTPQENQILDAMTKDEWEKLDSAKDEATKYQLQSHARQHVEKKLFQCNTEDSHNCNTEMLRDNKSKEISPSEAHTKVEDACLKATEKSKVLTCLMANNEVQDGPKRQETPGSTENGLTLLCAVALGNQPDEKENGPMEEHKAIAVKSEGIQMDVDVKKEL
ncbi:hypothetical protein PoB_006179400 [Plakobranchus ocellatus]|uniref:Uncharacterized protein n=1 Tax=Plakobranchus ocellatus TaxID=259542 RepID=A0AAV4CTT3_9GAST|nr:hypothetical protein PoB_006179400 [Plakobranchus ocellatus]